LVTGRAFSSTPFKELSALTTPFGSDEDFEHGELLAVSAT